MDNGISRTTAATILNSLKSGVVPRTGLEYRFKHCCRTYPSLSREGRRFVLLKGNTEAGKPFLCMHLETT